MNDVMRATIIAEEIADRYGDLSRFVRDYESRRSTSGIMDSIRWALEQQKLLDIFEGRQ